MWFSEVSYARLNQYQAAAPGGRRTVQVAGEAPPGGSRTEAHHDSLISHSFENKPEFENVTDALQLRGVEYWNPAEIHPGASLREQLRAAVERCNVCIFIATRQSVDSSWCGAELGAFLGTGKPIIVYLAEASLKEDELPQIVQGDVWEAAYRENCRAGEGDLSTRPNAGRFFAAQAGITGVATDS